MSSPAQQKIWDDIQGKRDKLLANINDETIDPNTALMVQALMYVGDCTLATHHIPNCDRIFEY